MSTKQLGVPVPGYMGKYLCLPSGHVWSMHRRKILGSPNQDGYLKTAIFLAGKRKDVTIHQLVALTFLGKCPAGYVVNHKNGVRDDNRPENLEYLSPGDNERHARKVLGKRCLGEKSSRSKLRDNDIRRIRGLRERGRTMRSIADTFGVSFAQIQRICSGKNWGHVR